MAGPETAQALVSIGYSFSKREGEYINI